MTKDYEGLVQGFVEFLESKDCVESVKIDNVSEEIINRGRMNGGGYVRGERVGIFINGWKVGNLDFYDDEIWYAGRVPGIELKDTIDLNPSKVPGSFIRMIYCLKDNRRDDSWDVPFP